MVGKSILRGQGQNVALNVMLENVHLGEALEARKAGSLASGIGSLARAALPFAFATAAQAIVVIAGGIDLGRSRPHH